MPRHELPPAKLAKFAAFHDIAEDCKKSGEGRNYLLWEDEICAMLGIKKPDFRVFNGGNNKEKKI